MSLEPEVIVERRRLKRSRALWRFAAIAVLFIFVSVLLAQEGLNRLSHVAYLTIQGVIDDDHALVEAIDKVAEEDSAKALLIAIDSPGGTVTGSEAIYDALRRVAAEKPVVAVMGSVAASGGYIVALGADRIFAQRNTLTGSIGVIMQATEISGLLGKLGVTVNELKSAPLKGEPSFFTPMSEKARLATQALIDDSYAWFVGLVAERRKLPPPEAQILGDGRVYSGQQAVALKLIDALGDEKAARLWLKSDHGISKDLPRRDINPQPPIRGLMEGESSAFSGVFALLTGKALVPKRLTLDGLVAIWHPSF